MDQKALCFTIPAVNYRSGIVRVVVNLVNALQHTKKYCITVLALEPDGNSELPLAEGIRLEVLQYEKNQAPGAMSKIDKYFKITKCLKKYFRKNSFQLCVVSGKEYATFFYLACKKNKLSFVMWEHTNYSVGVPMKSEWVGMNIALRRFKGIVCLTHKDEKAYLSNKKVAEIRQICNLTTYQESDATYCIQSKKIISVGSLEAVKGFDILLDVARIVFTKHPDWSWDIYGEGKERDNLEKMIAEYGLVNNVRLMGYCENISERYSEYAMFVMTSRREGMGVVMLEAQKNHLPIVAFDVLCGPSDVISEGVNGHLILPFQTQTMADRICELIEQPEKRVEFSRHACDRHHEFEPEYIISKWEQLISDYTREA